MTEDYGKVVCSLSGKLRSRLEYDLQLGEDVQVEISLYDDDNGRIDYKGWKRTSVPPTTTSNNFLK